MIIGILQKATQSKEITERAKIIEEAKMDVLAKQAENHGSLSEDELVDILTSTNYNTQGKLSNEKSILDRTLTSKDRKYEIPVYEIYNGTFSTEGALESGLYNSDTNELIYSWEELVNLRNIVTVDNNTNTLSRNAFNIGNINVKLVIDESIQNIGGMSRIPQLKELIIPSSITSIGNDSFSGCSNLTTVEFPDTLTSIGEKAFYQCNSLTDFKIPDSVISIGKNAFRFCKGPKTLQLNISTISEGAFCACTNIEKIEFGSNVRTIGKEAFNYCTSLVNIEIPDNVTSTGEMAFYACHGLESVAINSWSIGAEAFRGCDNLTLIELGNNVSSISSNSFCDDAYNKGLALKIVVKSGSPLTVPSNKWGATHATIVKE